MMTRESALNIFWTVLTISAKVGMFFFAAMVAIIGGIAAGGGFKSTFGQRLDDN
jgi:hypothetical protein